MALFQDSPLCAAPEKKGGEDRVAKHVRDQRKLLMGMSVSSSGDLAPGARDGAEEGE